MKDIMLKITGNQFSGDDQDRVEFITAGTMFSDNEATYISYDETEISGFEGCSTKLTIKPESVVLTRSGSEMGETVMCFEKGKRYSGFYSTPMGNIGLELLTNDVRGVAPGESISKLSIDYDISLKGIIESRNTIDIEILGEVQ